MDTNFGAGTYPGLTVRPDPTINPAKGQSVASSIHSELYETDDEYQQLDPIVGSSPSGRLQHTEMLGDD